MLEILNSLCRTARKASRAGCDLSQGKAHPGTVWLVNDWKTNTKSQIRVEEMTHWVRVSQIQVLSFRSTTSK